MQELREAKDSVGRSVENMTKLQLMLQLTRAGRTARMANS